MTSKNRMAAKVPLYSRALRLRHLRIGGLASFLLFECMIAVGVLLGLAELVSWWAAPVLPAVVAIMVKLNDLAMAPARGRAGRVEAPAHSADRRVADSVERYRAPERRAGGHAEHQPTGASRAGRPPYERDTVERLERPRAVRQADARAATDHPHTDEPAAGYPRDQQVAAERARGREAAAQQMREREAAAERMREREAAARRMREREATERARGREAAVHQMREREAAAERERQVTAARMREREAARNSGGERSRSGRGSGERVPAERSRTGAQRRSRTETGEPRQAVGVIRLALPPRDGGVAGRQTGQAAGGAAKSGAAKSGAANERPDAANATGGAANERVSAAREGAAHAAHGARQTTYGAPARNEPRQEAVGTPPPAEPRQDVAGTPHRGEPRQDVVDVASRDEARRDGVGARHSVGNRPLNGEPIAADGDRGQHVRRQRTESGGSPEGGRHAESEVAGAGRHADRGWRTEEDVRQRGSFNQGRFA